MADGDGLKPLQITTVLVLRSASQERTSIEAQQHHWEFISFMARAPWQKTPRPPVPWVSEGTKDSRMSWFRCVDSWRISEGKVVSYIFIYTYIFFLNPRNLGKMIQFDYYCHMFQKMGWWKPNHHPRFSRKKVFRDIQFAINRWGPRNVAETTVGTARSLQLTPPEGAEADSNSTSRQVSLSPDPQVSHGGFSGGWVSFLWDLLGDLLGMAMGICLEFSWGLWDETNKSPENQGFKEQMVCRCHVVSPTKLEWQFLDERKRSVTRLHVWSLESCEINLQVIYLCDFPSGGHSGRRVGAKPKEFVFCLCQPPVPAVSFLVHVADIWSNYISISSCRLGIPPSGGEK